MNGVGKKKFLTWLLAVIVVLVVVFSAIELVHHQRYVAKAPTPFIIEITKNGFVPATARVKVGDTVKWENSDSAPRQIASNPYPADSSIPALNSHTLLPDTSYSYTFKSSVTAEYHDETRPTNNGTIVVE